MDSQETPMMETGNRVRLVVLLLIVVGAFTGLRAVDKLHLQGELALGPGAPPGFGFGCPIGMRACNYSGTVPHGGPCGEGAEDCCMNDMFVAKDTYECGAGLIDGVTFELWCDTSKDPPPGGPIPPGPTNGICVVKEDGVCENGVLDAGEQCDIGVVGECVGDAQHDEACCDCMCLQLCRKVPPIPHGKVGPGGLCGETLCYTDCNVALISECKGCEECFPAGRGGDTEKCPSGCKCSPEVVANSDPGYCELAADGEYYKSATTEDLYCHSIGNNPARCRTTCIGDDCGVDEDDDDSGGSPGVPPTVSPPPPSISPLPPQPPPPNPPPNPPGSDDDDDPPPPPEPDCAGLCARIFCPTCYTCGEINGGCGCIEGTCPDDDDDDPPCPDTNVSCQFGSPLCCNGQTRCPSCADQLGSCNPSRRLVCHDEQCVEACGSGPDLCSGDSECEIEDECPDRTFACGSECCKYPQLCRQNTCIDPPPPSSSSSSASSVDPFCGDGEVQGEWRGCTQGPVTSYFWERMTASLIRSGCQYVGEQCDDGNTNDGDGCDSSCNVEVCGNGLIQIGEECDDGAYNGHPRGGCRDDCTKKVCGDGMKDLGEQCDDGENNGTDESRCKSDCELRVCGDGIVDADLGEECEWDGGRPEIACPGKYDVCRTCKCFPQGQPYCGDGNVDFGEQCDAGTDNRDIPDYPCRPNCQLRRCGDEIVDRGAGETCDDGNTVSGDGCTNCLIEAHTECDGRQCFIVPGLAPNECDLVLKCSVERHTVCENKQCVYKNGPGPNECSDSIECQKHTECIDDKCVVVDDIDLDTETDPKKKMGTCCSFVKDSNKTEVAVDVEKYERVCGKIPRLKPGEIAYHEPTPDCHGPTGGVFYRYCSYESQYDCSLNRNPFGHPYGVPLTHYFLENDHTEEEEELNKNQCDPDDPNACIEPYVCSQDDCPNIGMSPCARVYGPESRCITGTDGVRKCYVPGECSMVIQTCLQNECGYTSTLCSCQDTICGNGFIDYPEQCDNGDDNVGFGKNIKQGECRYDCRFPSCGDGIVDAPTEQCEKKLNGGLEDDRCRDDCTSKICGDGIVDADRGEECDDGNKISGDGCDVGCQVELCGDGYVQAALGEECDLGLTCRSSGGVDCGDCLERDGLGNLTLCKWTNPRWNFSKGGFWDWPRQECLEVLDSGGCKEKIYFPPEIASINVTCEGCKIKGGAIQCDYQAKQCTQIPKKIGKDLCKRDEQCDLSGPTHLACIDGACVEVGGPAGAQNQCTDHEDCHHLACRDGACTFIPGAGISNCSTDADCPSSDDDDDGSGDDANSSSSLHAAGPGPGPGPGGVFGGVPPIIIPPVVGPPPVDPPPHYSDCFPWHGGFKCLAFFGYGIDQCSQPSDCSHVDDDDGDVDDIDDDQDDIDDDNDSDDGDDDEGFSSLSSIAFSSSSRTDTDDEDDDDTHSSSSSIAFSSSSAIDGDDDEEDEDEGPPQEFHAECFTWIDGSICLLVEGPGEHMCPEPGAECDGDPPDFSSSSSIAPPPEPPPVSSQYSASSESTLPTSFVCINNECVLVPGDGPQECNLAFGCPPRRSVCYQNQCTTIDIPGPTECSSDIPCNSYTTCVGEQCVVVEGIPPPDHEWCDIERGCSTFGRKICVLGQCVPTSDPGAHGCHDHVECQDDTFSSAPIISSEPTLSVPSSFSSSSSSALSIIIAFSSSSEDIVFSSVQTDPSGSDDDDNDQDDQDDEDESDEDTGSDDDSDGTDDDDGSGEDDDGIDDNDDTDDDGDQDEDDGIPGNQDGDDDGDGDEDDGIRGNGPSLVAAATVCGNGTLEHSEECDDSNARDNDGCSSTCLLEIGICGDGIVQSLLGEQCEAATHDPALPYECNKCRFLSRTCGNGAVDPGEECDLGLLNSSSPDAECRPDCSSARCGDGVTDTQTEECDDGNRINDDGCDRYCREERTAVAAEVQEQGPLTSSDNIDQSSQDTYGGFNPYAQQIPMHFGSRAVGFPQYPNYGQVPYQLPLAQLQPLVQSRGPIGDTGPAAVAVIGAGAAAGLGWIRRRKK